MAPLELPDWHIECKGTKQVQPPPSIFKSWWDQLTRDCPDHKKPIIFWKANGKEPLCLVKNIVHFLPQHVIVPYDTIFYTGMEHSNLTFHDCFENIRRIRCMSERHNDNLLICNYYLTDAAYFQIAKADELMKRYRK